MKAFLDDNFLLENKFAEQLYHEHAKDQPIIDYHCHLPPEDVAADRQFNNLTEIWLEGDHYKWRAMRTNGVPEAYCTGDADPKEKFLKWAETVPYTLRNPLYHWTHLELRRYFGIQEILSPATAEKIYDEASAQLQTPAFSARNILRNMKVEVVGTTDDPTDSLEYHQQLKAEGFDVKILPSFRPDKALKAEDPAIFNAYMDKLGAVTSNSLEHYIDLLDALKQRIDFFHELGGRLSDHGLEQLVAEPFEDEKVNYIFQKVRLGNELTQEELLQYQSSLLYHLGLMYHEKGWTQQFHVGALRNNNSRMKRLLGPDTGFDSIGDFEMARPVAHFLDSLDVDDKLAKTILYNLNPRDNALFATMIGNFNTGPTPGKIQFGSGWWFLDQKKGMEDQMAELSNMGLLPRFVGMLTDSRSFMSYPRHEYFRRILCNLFGKDVENGELPADREWLGKVIENICYYNAKQYFNF